MKKQEEFGLILFKTNHAYNSTPKWILAQWNYISTAQREEEKLLVIARRVILMVKHFFLKNIYCHMLTGTLIALRYLRHIDEQLV